MGLFDKFQHAVDITQQKIDAAQQRISDVQQRANATQTHSVNSTEGIAIRYCRNCGDPLGNGANFCAGCGAAVEAVRYCPNCGTVLNDDAKFCPDCGTAAAIASDDSKRETEYAFFDVETPNRRNDCICSIAVIRTDSHGNVIGQKYTLVDPDAEFDAINTSIHGITEFDVHGAPPFPAAWNEVQPLLHDAVLVAHNARFDLTVLDKTLAFYGIEHGCVDYACTMSMSMEQHPEIGRFKLGAVCEAFDVPLTNHHHAMADAEACKAVFFALDEPAELSEYVPQSLRAAKSYKRQPSDHPRSRVYNVERSSETKSHNELMKHATDVLADGRVTINEAIGLRWWLEKNANLSNDPTVTQLLALLSSVLEDGVIDPDEEAQLIEALGRIVNPFGDGDVSEEIDGKKFCLTGDFEYGSKDEVASLLESMGGIRCKSVVKTCDYVIIGAHGSAAYAHGSYGGKVKKAMEWQDKGVPMKIVTEQDCPWL